MVPSCGHHALTLQTLVNDLLRQYSTSDNGLLQKRAKFLLIEMEGEKSTAVNSNTHWKVQMSLTSNFLCGGGFDFSRIIQLYLHVIYRNIRKASQIKLPPV